MKFSAAIYKIGINPYVLLPPAVLAYVFKQSGKDRGPLPVRIKIKDQWFVQTLVKYSGKWRLYLNGPMRLKAGKDVGDTISLDIRHDPVKRDVPMHNALGEALEKNKEAKERFMQLPPSRQKEIVRYIQHLKTVAAVQKNVERAVRFLQGNERFIGRDKP